MAMSLERDAGASGNASRARTWALLVGAVLVAAVGLVVVVILRPFDAGRDSVADGPLIVVKREGIFAIDANTGRMTREVGPATPDIARTVLDLTDSFRGTALSPDRRYVASVTELADIGGPVPRSVGVEVVDLSTGEHHLIRSPAEGTPAWSNQDSLAWLAETTLADGSPALAPAVNLLQRGGGSPVTWTAPDGSLIVSMAWSPTAEVLAISTLSSCGAAVRSNVYLIDGASGVGRPLIDGDFQADISWAPDGRMLAALVDLTGPCAQVSAGLDVITVDLATRHQTVVWPDGTTVPIWTPDGSRMIVQGASDLATVKLDGSARSEIVSDPFIESAALSPDGSHLAYTVSSPNLPKNAYGGTDTLFVGGIDGQAAVPIADKVWNNVTMPTWSPTGAWLAFVRSPLGTRSDRTSIRDQRSLWVVRPDGSDLHLVLDRPISSLSW
jgi:hypothetical protein